MKRLLSILIMIMSLISCKKNKDSATIFYCDGLITDTLGTGDNATIFFPNAFTPNSDGLNDVIRPITQNITSLTFTVYDTTGNVVFTTNSSPYSWNTTVMNNSAIKYYYQIQAKTNSNHQIGLCGSIYKLSCVPANVPRVNLYFEDELTPFGFSGTTAETLPNCQ